MLTANRLTPVGQTRKTLTRGPVRTNASRRRGLTLLELVVAMAVASFGLLGLQGFLLLMGRTVAEQVRATEALACAQEKLEELRFRAAGRGFREEGEEPWGGATGPGMARRWSVEGQEGIPGVLRVRVECGCLVRGREVGQRLETLVCPEE